jgi:hypothetical protein
MKTLIIVLLLLSSFSASSFSQRIARDVARIVEQEYGKNNLEITPLQKDSNLPDFVKQIWVVDLQDGSKNYLYQFDIKGRAHVFDALLLLTSKADVLQVGIINYPSNHGINVTNKRWLKKLRFESDKKYSYGENVDALSGATISAINLLNSIEAIRSFTKKQMQSTSY